MAKYIDADKIKAEIERRMDGNKKQLVSCSDSWMRLEGEMDCLIEMLSFLDTLESEHLADERKMIEPEKKEGRTDCSPQGEVPNDSLATQSYEEKSEEQIPEGLDEDIITLHLGKILPDEQYNEVVRSVVAFMNQRWPNCKVGVDN